LAPVEITSRVATVGIIVVSIMMGTVPIFARELTDGGMAPVAVVFYRNMAGFLVLGVFLRVTREKRRAFAWVWAGPAMSKRSNWSPLPPPPCST